MPKRKISEIIIRLRKVEELSEEYRCIAEELAEDAVIGNQMAANLVECYKGAIEKILLISEHIDLPTEVIYDMEDLVKDMRATLRSAIVSSQRL